MPFFVLTLFLFVHFASAQTASRWELNRVDSISGTKTTILGSPKVVSTASGNAVEFNGKTDGILVDLNPVANASEFTIEAIFKPDTSSSVEPRFVHIEQDANNRITLEARISGTNWYLDTYIKSGSSERTLLSSGFLHPIGKWYHVALVYKNGTMTDYVNGSVEMSGSVTYVTQTSGKTGIGYRQNLKYWFDGQIKTLKATPNLLQPNSFITDELKDLNSALGFQDSDAGFETDFFFSPNPSSNVVYLNIQLEKPQEITWSLFDANGHEVKKGVPFFCFVGTNKLEIAREDLSAGMYLAKISVGKYLITKPIVFQAD